MKYLPTCIALTLFVLFSPCALASVHDDTTQVSEHLLLGSGAVVAHTPTFGSAEEPFECMVFNELADNIRKSKYTPMFSAVFPPAIILLLPLTCTGINENGDLLLKIITAP